MKGLKSIIHRHLVSTLEHHHLLSSSQSGFKNKRSMVTLLTEAVNDWSLSLEKKKVLCIAYYYILLKCLIQYPMSIFQVLWGVTILANIRSFLTNRKQRVVINGVFSNWDNITSRVPASSCCSYVNDLDSVVNNSTVKLFADDVLLYASANTQQECSALNCNLQLGTRLRWQLKLVLLNVKQLSSQIC